jgi:hypothetical protein
MYTLAGFDLTSVNFAGKENSSRPHRLGWGFAKIKSITYGSFFSYKITNLPTIGSISRPICSQALMIPDQGCIFSNQKSQTG